MIYIGSHISSSKGYAAMGRQALKLGADTFAFFTRNPRGGSAKEIRQEDVDKFLKIAEEGGFGKLVAHAPYTLNACSADADVRNFAKQVFADDLKRMEYIPGNMYNFHPGSHVKQGVDTGIEYIAQMLNEVLDKNQHTKVLLETMAGKGTEIGRSFEELQMIIEKVELNNNLGICLDTCHIYDAQYNIVDNLNGVIDELDKVIGLDRLCAIHLNDSKNPFASHKDRHELIGKGYIGIDTFNNIVSNEKLRNIPMYLETPNDMEGYAKEIAMLKQMYAKAH